MKMRFLIVSIILVLCISFGNSKDAESENNKILTEKTYAKLFLLRRKENKELLGIISAEDSYERKYKLIEAAYGKIFKILEEAKKIISNSDYNPLVEKFPKDKSLVDAITVALENTCLFGDMILYFPDISYRVLHSRHEPKPSISSKVHWRDLINWCLSYAENFYDRIIDSKSRQLLLLANQEINPEKRTPEFVNPYRDLEDRERIKNEHKKKPPKKLKKGPQMAGGRDEL